MICPDTDFDCDNPGCRHGGCQGRRPHLPLLRALADAGSPRRSDIDQALIAASASTSKPDRGNDGRA